MGTIVSFRYNKPGKPTKPPAMILLLTPNYLGNLHGIKISQLTQTEQQYLQNIFRSIYTNQKDFFEPLMASIERQTEEIEILNKQRAELLKNGQKVVMRPSSGGFFGQAVDKGRQMLGSVIGKIKTFGRTQAQPVQQQPSAQVQEEINRNAQALTLKQQQLTEYMKYLQEQKTLWAQIGRVPREPYGMYHQIIKPMIGRWRMPTMYRKYNVNYIQSPRIVKSPGVVYAT